MPIASVARHQGSNKEGPLAEVTIASLDALSQPSTGMSDARPGMQQTLAGFTPVSADLNRRNADQSISAVEGIDSNSLYSDAELDWWDLTFVEAGFTHLEGLEPIGNFRGI